MKFNREDVISELDTQIRWIEDIDAHKFPGWCGVTMAMRYAMILLQKQEELKRRMMQYIADIQLANAPIETMDATSHTYYDGVWHGLEMAYKILTKEEENQ